MQDRRIKVSQIVGEMGVSEGSVITILHDHVVMSKVSSQWVPECFHLFKKKHELNFQRRIWVCGKLTRKYLSLK